MIGSTINHYSTTHLQDVAVRLFRAALSSSTSSAYEGMFKRYHDFCVTHFPDSHLLPSTQDMVAQFISSLFLDNSCPSTIASPISAISFAHKGRGFHDPTCCFVIRIILKGIQNTNGTVDTRLPITCHILTEMLSAISQVINGRYYQSLLKAMFLLAFHAFLRISEITMKRQSDRRHLTRQLTLQYLYLSTNIRTIM